MVNFLLYNIQTINLLYAASGLFLLVMTVVLAFDYKYNHQKLYNKFLTPYIWWIIILTTFGGVATTLLYSEVFGFVPCSLCWVQRIALYPQVFLALIALNLKDTKYFPVYGIALSIFGFFVSVYQYILQALPQELHESGILPCLADGSADCSQKIIDVFGFVTFPFLSGVLFLFLIVLYLYQFRAGREKT